MDRRKFTASVLHELRTPLAALASEVEIALRRGRTPAAYREVLMRVSVQAAELIDLTGDLALFANPGAFKGAQEATTELQVLMRHLALRFDSDQVAVIPPVRADVRIAGDEGLLIRSLQLLLDHATRHRGPGSPVRLRALIDESDPSATIDMVLDASTPGFTATTWHYLLYDDAADEMIGRSGLMRLHTAAYIVRMCGGSVAIDGHDGHVSVRVGLARAR